MLKVVQTKPYDDQKMGTAGLRRKSKNNMGLQHSRQSQKASPAQETNYRRRYERKGRKSRDIILSLPEALCSFFSVQGGQEFHWTVSRSMGKNTMESGTADT